MRTYHWIFTALGLVGLHGCDDAEPIAEAPVYRNVGYLGPPELACLKDTQLTLFHADGTKDAADDIGEGLAQYARPNDEIEVSFSVPSECLDKFGPRLSLVSYTSPGIVKYVMKPGQPARAHDMHTRRLAADEVGVLRVRLPDCFFRVELAFGEPLASLDGSESIDRVIASAQGGDSSCEDIPRLEIAAFDTVERGWGDAPLLTHFGWGIKTGDGGIFGEKPPPLTCELDFEGDGKVDEVVSPCVQDTAAVKLDTLPEHSYAQAGEHQPELVVTDGVRRMWANTSVLANHLEYQENVRFPEKSPGFVSGTLTPATAPALTKLVLQYSSKSIPFMQAGDVIVGSGYMLRIFKIVKIGTTVSLTGTPVGLDETIAGGYFGVRDVRVATSGMKCRTPPCLGTLTSVAETPPGFAAPKPALAIGAPMPALLGPEDKYGFKIAVDLGEGEGGTSSEAELFGGIVVKKFAVDGLIFGDLKVDIDLAPTIEATVAIKAEIADELSLGQYTIGALPLPVPVTITLTPTLSFASAFKFAGKFTMAAPIQLMHDQSGWRSNLDPKITGDAQLLEGGLASEASLESKFTFAPEVGFALGPLDGPYVAPVASLGIKATANFDSCDFCMTVFAEIGGELGWHVPWGLPQFFDVVQLLIELELRKACETMPPPCEPPPPPPPGGGGGGGGTWGDVHVVSHDGLLFDFQAGGEFVLVRATSGAPFELQARQEPLADQLSLSYNTAIATVIGGEKVGIYAGHSPPLYKNNGFIELLPGTSVAPGGGGLIARAADGRYLLTYPSGETVRVDLVGAGDFAHLDIAVELPPGRANQVEGVLGDADGVTANDIGLGGDAFLPQPVTFEQLYRGTGSFTEKWRVAQSLFVYTDGESAATYGGAPYSEMPLSTPSPNPDHQALAVTECAQCPAALRDTCMLDVAFTGEPSFADGCMHAPGTPSAVLVPADDFVIVSPRYGAPIDCSDPKLVFRGPGIANADQYPLGMNLAVVVSGYTDSPYSNTTELEHLYTFLAPPGGGSNWGTKFECHSIASDDSWGQCTMRLSPDVAPCKTNTHPHYTWSAFSTTGSNDYSDMAVFNRL